MRAETLLGEVEALIRSARLHAEGQADAAEGESVAVSEGCIG